MNRTVLALLLDYHRRTLGAWILLVFVQLMQISAIWALGKSSLPLVGAVIAFLTFCATWNSPHLVMRTLPITARDLALLRWWQCIAMPTLFITLAYVLAWFSNYGSQFPTPKFASLWLPIGASVATLAFLAVLPLPRLSAQRANTPVIAVVWIALPIGALLGVPAEWLPAPGLLLTSGLLLGVVSFGLARSGRVLEMPPLARMFGRAASGARETSRATSRFSGWPVLVLQWMRAIFLLAFASIVVISIVRPQVHVLQQALPWIFVSVTGAVGTIIGRRWLRSVRALQCLPIRTPTLALLICLALMAPVVLTTLAATAVNAAVPEWGIGIPVYMVPVFAIVPALEISWYRVETNHAIPSTLQQWSPIMQIVAWPLWTGSFMSLELTRLLPKWFEMTAVAAAAVLAVVAYGLVLQRIRSGQVASAWGVP